MRCSIEVYIQLIVLRKAETFGCMRCSIEVYIQLYKYEPKEEKGV